MSSLERSRLDAEIANDVIATCVFGLMSGAFLAIVLVYGGSSVFFVKIAVVLAAVFVLWLHLRDGEDSDFSVWKGLGSAALVIAGGLFVYSETQIGMALSIGGCVLVLVAVESDAEVTTRYD